MSVMFEHFAKFVEQNARFLSSTLDVRVQSPVAESDCEVTSRDDIGGYFDMFSRHASRALARELHVKKACHK